MKKIICIILLLSLVNLFSCKVRRLTNKELIIGEWISLADTTYNATFTKSKYQVNGTELFYYWPAVDSFICYGEPFIHASGQKGRIVYYHKLKKLDEDSLIYWAGFGQGLTEYSFVRKK